jgi:conjugative relaxase-like TrwC/TraI family protein
MISIGKITSVEQAVRYLREAIADQQLEYYTARGESPGRWAGDGADALDLRGEVGDSDFAAVLSGLHPRSGEQLGRHWATQHVVAFDVAVSAPKDVSILYALGNERQRAAILRIHSEGVRAAAGYLQAEAGWARQYNRETRQAEPVRARLVMPEFVHRTARPVTDPATGTVTVDPQLHTHITVPNWALRPDGSWGQLYSEPLYQHAAAAGAIAQAEWRDRLVRELGVSTTVDGRGCFAIVGITEAQRREFSRRTAQIEAAEHALDIDSFHGHKVAVVDTRESKDELAPNEDLFAQWRQRATSVGLDANSVEAVLRREPEALSPRRLDVSDPQQLLGIRGLTAQRATFTRRDLVRAIAAHAPLGMPRAQIEATANGILSDSAAVLPLVPVKLDGETDAEAIGRRSVSGHEVRYTTPEMLAIEERMVVSARRRANAAVGVAAAQPLAAALAARPTLTNDQRSMIETVCTTPAGVVVVEGAAGVGKTMALDACREAFAASGVPVVGCALAGKAAQGLQEGSAIPAWTVTAMLNELQLDRLPLGGVLVVDEAGMVGDRQLAELVGLAERDDVKLVLIGDPCQLQPIEAGAPLRMLGEHIGKVLMVENVRQDAEWERAALSLMRDGEARAALEEYQHHGRIHTAPTAVDRDAAVVEEHRALTARGVDAVILARRRDEIASLNERARLSAIRDRRLTGPALLVGDKEYQAGDPIICLANDRRRDITNGTRGVVTAVDVEHRTLSVRRSDGRELTIDTDHYEAIDRGYALTVHKAQGMTADVALVVGSDGATREWAYTAMSRATVATHYFDVERPPEHDRLDVHHGQEPPRPVGERITRSWSRSVQNDSALDYPERYEKPETRPDPTGTRLAGLATDAQRVVLADLGAELPTSATWMEASLEIDRCLGRTPGSQLRPWLRDLGVSEESARALIRSAASRPPRDLAAAGPDLGISPGEPKPAVPSLANNPLVMAAALEPLPSVTPGIPLGG